MNESIMVYDSKLLTRPVNLFGYKDPLGEFIFHKSILFAQTQSETLPPLHILLGIAIRFGRCIYFLPSNNRSDDKCAALMPKCSGKKNA